MIQHRYVLDDRLSMSEMIDKIKNSPEYVNGKKGLLQLIEPSNDSDLIQKDLDTLCENLPGLSVFGMTNHGALSRENHSVEVVVCCVIFFDKAYFSIDVFDCSAGLSTYDAGEEYVKLLKDKKDLKGILMMSSAFDLCPETFIDRVAGYDKDIVMFGALAGTHKMGDDRSKIFVGQKIYNRGILAVAFCGEDLNLDYYYNLGFKSLGKELVVTKSDDKGIVYEINNKPAFSVYQEHLGIGMNEYFFENTSSFPFFLKDNGIPLARVALEYRDDGALCFATQIPQGSSVSLSYSTTDMLLSESGQNAVKISEFYPEAILIYACMSRRMLMGDAMAELEFDFYEHVLSSSTWASGYGEILHADGMRGFLNASCVVVGMREGPVPEEKDRPIYHFDSKYMCSDVKNPEDGFLPLSTRLVNFLESTTLDLREANEQLFKVASLDELTQIYNRRALNYFMNKFLENRSRYQNIAVMMVDVDHFKHVNDTYGHDAGDMVLRDGVGQVKFLFNQADVIGRWGGEEFVGIKPNLSFEEAKEFCEAMREGVAQMEFGEVGHITISIGLTMVKDKDSADSVFKRIDEALYEAKETGRNKVVVR